MTPPEDAAVLQFIRQNLDKPVELGRLAAELLSLVRFALVRFCDPESVDIDPAAFSFKANADEVLAKYKGGDS